MKTFILFCALFLASFSAQADVSMDCSGYNLIYGQFRFDVQINGEEFILNGTKAGVRHHSVAGNNYLLDTGVMWTIPTALLENMSSSEVVRISTDDYRYETAICSIKNN